MFDPSAVEAARKRTGTITAANPTNLPVLEVCVCFKPVNLHILQKIPFGLANQTRNQEHSNSNLEVQQLKKKIALLEIELKRKVCSLPNHWLLLQLIWISTD